MCFTLPCFTCKEVCIFTSSFSLVKLQLCVHAVEEEITQLFSRDLSSEHGTNVYQTLGLQVAKRLLEGLTGLLQKKEEKYRPESVKHHKEDKRRSQYILKYYLYQCTIFMDLCCDLVTC